METLKYVKGYEGLYLISNSGHIYRKTPDGKYIEMKPYDNGTGYMAIRLTKNKQRKRFYLHRLVAETFLNNINNAPEVNHIDYDKANNAAENLEWCSRKENCAHMVKRYNGFQRHRAGSSTEAYIHKYKKRFIVRIHGKKYGSFRDINEAIETRNAVLKEVFNYEI